MSVFDKLSEDYEGRCGNCHAFISEKDKFCKFCGTEKGKGEFLPYENDMFCIYGPPLLKVLKCNGCGYRMGVVNAIIDKPKYCPQCRDKNLKLIREERREIGDFIGTDMSECLPEGYQFLSEQEIEVALRIGADEKNDIDVEERLAAAGLEDLKIACDCDEIELTEKVAERANLLSAIVNSVKGDNAFANNKICPNCDGRIVARIKFYDEKVQDYDELYYKVGYMGSEKSPKWYCLHCGKKF